MTDGLLILALGALVLTVVQLWLPREMRKVGERTARRGGEEGFDAMLRSRSYRLAVAAVTMGGGLALATGTLLLITEIAR
jgi:hypothetical protein